MLDEAALIERIRKQAAEGSLRITRHAAEEMAEEDFALDDVLEGIASARLVENYPEHRRGACALLSGTTRGGRPIHVVSTTEQPIVIVITVYEPRPPKWVTPTQRGK